MIYLQAALNGDRQHPRTPRTPETIAHDVSLAAALGVQTVHVHAYDPDGRETLDGAACAGVLGAIRLAQPDLPISLTTSASIIADTARRQAAIKSWTILPDLVTANQGEDGIVELCEHLMSRGVGIEAGLLSIQDARKFAEWAGRHSCRRVLIEPLDADPEIAVRHAVEMGRIVEEAGVTLAQVHHGDGVASWAVSRRALALGHGMRAGLEDTPVLPDGTSAEDNEQLIRVALNLIYDQEGGPRRVR